VFRIHGGDARPSADEHANAAALRRHVIALAVTPRNLWHDESLQRGRVPGVAWSDRWSFWRHRYRALMLTDTAPYRYPQYHSIDDITDRLDYERMAEVVAGCAAAIRAWSGNSD
jgi:hypothetical protein